MLLSKRGKLWFLFYLKIYYFNCLLQGPSFILHKLYNTEWPNWSTSGQHRPLVACLCGAQTRCQCLKEVGSMHSVGASSVHSSNSDGLIRDMPAIADLNITSVSKIQDKPEKPIKKKKRNSTNVTLQKLSQTLWMVAGHPQSLTTLSSNIYCQLFTVSTFGGFQWTRQIGGFTQV